MSPLEIYNESRLRNIVNYRAYIWHKRSNFEVTRQDLQQEGWRKICTYVNRFDPTLSNLATWVTMVADSAMSSLVDKEKTYYKRREYLEGDYPFNSTIIIEFDYPPFLNKREIELLELRRIGNSYADIAEQWGVKITTVYDMFGYVKKRLRHVSL